MQNLLGILFDDLRVTLALLFFAIVLTAVFSTFSGITDTYIDNEQTKENIESIQAISINGLYLFIAVSGIATLLALLGWITGFFESILDLIQFSR
jgi:Flp pilus assembly pilin Flp